jgi:hypothetical protein
MSRFHPIPIDEQFGVTEADRPKVPIEMLRECRLKTARERIRTAVYYLSGDGRTGSGAWIKSDEQARSHVEWILGFLVPRLLPECEVIAKLPEDQQKDAIERLAAKIPSMMEEESNVAS